MDLEQFVEVVLRARGIQRPATDAEATQYIGDVYFVAEMLQRLSAAEPETDVFGWVAHLITGEPSSTGVGGQS